MIPVTDTEPVPGIREKTAEELAALVPIPTPDGEETCFAEKHLNKPWMRVSSSYGWEWWIDAAGKFFQEKHSSSTSD
jgi:hypothetical protein